MSPDGVVGVHPFADDPFGPETIRQAVQIDRLLLERPPEALDEDLVHASSPAAHRLAIPCAHLVGMNPVLRRDLLDRPVAL